jgi:hypothetical protein
MVTKQQVKCYHVRLSKHLLTRKDIVVHFQIKINFLIITLFLLYLKLIHLTLILIVRLFFLFDFDLVYNRFIEKIQKTTTINQSLAH